MAKVIGRNGVVKVSSNTVAEVVGFSFDEQCAVIDDSALGDQELTYVAGDITRTGSIECHWDKSDSTGQGALDIGSTVTLVLQREGDDTGDETLSFSAVITGKSTANAKGAMVSQNFTFQASGSVTEGTAA